MQKPAKPKLHLLHFRESTETHKFEFYCDFIQKSPSHPQISTSKVSVKKQEICFFALFYFAWSRWHWLLKAVVHFAILLMAVMHCDVLNIHCSFARMCYWSSLAAKTVTLVCGWPHLEVSATEKRVALIHIMWLSRLHCQEKYPGSWSSQTGIWHSAEVYKKFEEFCGFL